MHHLNKDVGSVTLWPAPGPATSVEHSAAAAAAATVAAAAAAAVATTRRGREDDNAAITRIAAS